MRHRCGSGGSCSPAGVFLAGALLLGASAADAHSVRFENGLWFDGERFVARTVDVVDGRIASSPSGPPDEHVDLAGRWVVPPLGDAHTHGFSDTQDPAADVRRLVSAGILFAKNPNSTSAGVARGRDGIAASGLPFRATFAGSGLTSPGGHPSQIYEAHGATDGWLAAASESDLDGIWPALLAPGPEFVKVYLERSEDHARIANDPAFRGRRGIDPALLATVVARARAAGLPVSVHVRTAADFRAAVAAGVQEINHLPLEEITDDDAADCAASGVRVVTTVLSHRALDGVENPSAIHRANLERLLRAGAPLALGTDNGGVDVVDEAIAVGRLGVVPAGRLVRLATTESIRACVGEGGPPGTLAAGEEASFLALHADPSADPAAFRKIDSIWSKGHRVEVAPEESKASLADALGHVMMGQGTDAAIAAYHEWKETRADEFDFSESQLNDLGYAVLRHGHAQDAVRILRLNVEQFPHSVNALDSLAEAQVAAGDAAGARNTSERILTRLGELTDVDAEFRRQLEESARERIGAAAGP